jgi:glycosyltransferase involved in cell wall biosynthesis
MRILQLAPPWFTVPPAGYGGTERMVGLLADGLAARGHDVTLLASGGSRTAARLWTVFDTPPSASLGSAVHELCHVLPAYQDRERFDVIHDHSGLIGPAMAGLLDGPPVVHTLHGAWSAAGGRIYAAIADRVHLVAISHDQASRAPADVRIATVIHNGIAVDDMPFRPDRRGTGGYLAFVGRASPDKGPDVAIAVAARLHRALRMAVKINEPHEQRYWEQHVVPLLDTADVQVRANGTAEYAVELMAGADATLFPIAWPEPFGLVMVESMACGTPVIAYAMGSAPEVVADGETGFLVPPGDVDGLCDATGKVPAIDPATCRQAVQESFSARAMTGRYERFLEAVVRGGPAAAPGAARKAPPNATPGATPRATPRDKGPGAGRANGPGRGHAAGGSCHQSGHGNDQPVTSAQRRGLGIPDTDHG